MKKLIVLIIAVLPAISFAQNTISENINQQKNTVEVNPFVSLQTNNLVSQEYLDINQTAAMLDLNNGRRTRGNTRGATPSLPATMVDLNTLTNGLNASTPSESKNETLKSVFSK